MGVKKNVSPRQQPRPSCSKKGRTRPRAGHARRGGYTAAPDSHFCRVGARPGPRGPRRGAKQSAAGAGAGLWAAKHGPAGAVTTAVGGPTTGGWGWAIVYLVEYLTKWHLFQSAAPSQARQAKPAKRGRAKLGPQGGPPSRGGGAWGPAKRWLYPRKGLRSFLPSFLKIRQKRPLKGSAWWLAPSGPGRASQEPANAPCLLPPAAT